MKTNPSASRWSPATTPLVLSLGLGFAGCVTSDAPASRLDPGVVADGLYNPNLLRVAPDGSVYFATSYDVRRIADDGTVTIVGDGFLGARGLVVDDDTAYLLTEDDLTDLSGTALIAFDRDGGQRQLLGDDLQDPLGLVAIGSDLYALTGGMLLGDGDGCADQGQLWQVAKLGGVPVLRASYEILPSGLAASAGQVFWTSQGSSSARGFCGFTASDRAAGPGLMSLLPESVRVASSDRSWLQGDGDGLLMTRSSSLGDGSTLLRRAADGETVALAEIADSVADGAARIGDRLFVAANDNHPVPCDADDQERSCRGYGGTVWEVIDGGLQAVVETSGVIWSLAGAGGALYLAIGDRIERHVIE